MSDQHNRIGRYNRIGIALTLSIAIAIFIVLFSNSAGESALLRGDFPGFYVLAKIVTGHQSERLYDLSLQNQIQNQAWPELNGNFLISVYPPSSALLLSPLGYFSALQAQIIFTLLSCICLGASFQLLKSRSLFLRDSPWLLFALVLTNPFVLIGTLGGQNTAFSIAILSFGTAYVEKMKLDGTKFYGILAGLIFSCWLFKPQFGILLIPGLIFFRLWLPLIGFFLGALLHYIAGIFLLGIFWPIEWFKKLAAFSELNYAANSINQASLIGSLEVALRHESIGITMPPIFIILGMAFIIAVILIRLLPRTNYNSNRFLGTFWAFLGSTPLVAAQTLFYDIGIVFMCLLNCVRSQDFNASNRNLLMRIAVTQIIAWILVLFRTSIEFPLFAFLALYYVAQSILIALTPKIVKKNTLV